MGSRPLQAGHQDWPLVPGQEQLDLTGISDELLHEVHGARDAYAADVSQLKVSCCISY